ncbi:MAG TPA: PAS domain-containing sensor histidine kinase [Sorangium sp.]|nr:PAS domain-containing sensor histidine kinase [Sorangium sp.]
MTSPEDGSGDALDLYDLAACGLLTTAADGTIQRVNRTMCGWTGFDAAELLGKRFQDLLTMGSKLFHHTHWMPLLQMQGSVAEMQLEMVRRDGRVLPVLVNAARREPKPGAAPAVRPPVDVAVFIATDRRKYERELLFARRRAEELENEFRTLAENSPDVIARFDRAHRFVYLSPAADGLTGKPVVDFIGKPIDQTGMASADTDAWVAAIDEAFAGRRSTLAFTYEVQGGHPREFQAHLVPERNSRGEIVTVLGLTRDVTVLRQQEREAQQRALVAEQLIGIVSHDLRNPLNAVLLGTQLLEDADAELQRVTTSRIAAAAHRANRLITDLLDFTQARLGGGLRVARREIHLHQVAADCLDEVMLAWPARQVEHRRTGDGLGLADPDRIAQILTNLVNNALTYGTPDQPVTVATSVLPGALEIQVHNAGRPIPPELQAKIFEPMQRGGAQARPGSRSVGLGLYIVREIASAHGGRVSVRSTEGEGTTFVVALPRAVGAGG